MENIFDRASQITGLNMNSSEDLQVGNYGIGGHYLPHLDYDISIPAGGCGMSSNHSDECIGEPENLPLHSSLCPCPWLKDGHGIACTMGPHISQIPQR